MQHILYSQKKINVVWVQSNGVFINKSHNIDVPVAEQYQYQAYCNVTGNNCPHHNEMEIVSKWEHFHFCVYLMQPLTKILSKLDKSTARWQLKSPRSLSGRSLDLILVTKWSRSHMTLKIQISRSWPRSNPLSNLRPRVQIDMFAFCLVPIGPLLVEI